MLEKKKIAQNEGKKKLNYFFLKLFFLFVV